MKNLFLPYCRLLPWLIMATTLSCSPPHEKSGTDSLKQKPPAVKRDNRKKPGSGLSDSLVIEGKLALFYLPDSLQWQKIEGVNEKMIYESLVHDCHFQMRNARLVMERYWPKIRRIETDHVRWLVFRKKSQARVVIDLDAVNDVCGIYLFDGIKDPERIDMMNVDTELGFYFGATR